MLSKLVTGIGFGCLVVFVMSCTTFRVSAADERIYPEGMGNFEPLRDKGLSVVSAIRSYNPDGIIGGLEFDNEQFAENVAEELGKKEFSPRGFNEKGITIFIQGEARTFYHPAQYFGVLYLYAIPTAIDYSNLEIRVNVSYRNTPLYDFRIKEKLETWGWIVPLLPVVPIKYNKSIAKELASRVSALFTDRDFTKRIAEIENPKPVPQVEVPVTPEIQKVMPSPINPPVLKLVSSGTGFFVGNDGYLLTNNHVVAGGKEFHILVGKNDYLLDLVATDIDSDLAVLKVRVSTTFPGLRVQTSAVHLGDRVYTIGFPNPEIQGIAPKFTSGEISSLKGIGDDVRYVQISVPIQPGNSGGPLVDSSGLVVGIVSSRLADARTFDTTGSLPQNVNYAVKITRALSILAENVPRIDTITAKTGDPAPTVEEVISATGMIGVYK